MPLIVYTAQLSIEVTAQPAARDFLKLPLLLSGFFLLKILFKQLLFPSFLQEKNCEIACMHQHHPSKGRCTAQKGHRTCSFCSPKLRLVLSLCTTVSLNIMCSVEKYKRSNHHIKKHQTNVNSQSCHCHPEGNTQKKIEQEVLQRKIKTDPNFMNEKTFISATNIK